MIKERRNQIALVERAIPRSRTFLDAAAYPASPAVARSGPVRAALADAARAR